MIWYLYKQKNNMSEEELKQGVLLFSTVFDLRIYFFLLAIWTQWRKLSRNTSINDRINVGDAS